MFTNKRILITGGTGSWGNELVTQILKLHAPKEIIIYSRGEIKQVEMRRTFNNHPKLKFVIGDVRSYTRLNEAMKGVHYVFHLAALKHVPVCETNPWEAVLTNIYGTENVIRAAIENNVIKVIDISSDKAVDPLNVYGVTKSCGEKLTIAANLETTMTMFVCIRGGNVIGTNGSAIPLFREQILRSNELTLTDKRMTRYLFSLRHAIGLIFRATEISVGGEIFVMKMPAAKMIDVAQVMIDELGNHHTKIKNIGIRPGEKIHEVLVSRYEADRVIEHGNYFIILPYYKNEKLLEKYKKAKFIKLEEYTSENANRLDKENIKDLLKEENWLSADLREQKSFISNLTKKELIEFFSREGWIQSIKKKN